MQIHIYDLFGSDRVRKTDVRVIIDNQNLFDNCGLDCHSATYLVVNDALDCKWQMSETMECKPRTYKSYMKVRTMQVLCQPVHVIRQQWYDTMSPY